MASPTLELYVNSWNAKYGSGTNSAKLKVTKASNGYNIMEDKDTVTSNSNYYINVTQYFFIVKLFIFCFFIFHCHFFVLDYKKNGLHKTQPIFYLVFTVLLRLLF